MQLHSKSGFIFTIILIQQNRDRNLFSLGIILKEDFYKIGTHPIFSKMDYLVVSHAAKRFE